MKAFYRKKIFSSFFFNIFGHEIRVIQFMVNSISFLHTHNILNTLLNDDNSCEKECNVPPIKER